MRRVCMGIVRASSQDAESAPLPDSSSARRLGVVADATDSTAAVCVAYVPSASTAGRATAPPPVIFVCFSSSFT